MSVEETWRKILERGGDSIPAILFVKTIWSVLPRLPWWTTPSSPPPLGSLVLHFPTFPSLFVPVGTEWFVRNKRLARVQKYNFICEKRKKQIILQCLERVAEEEGGREANTEMIPTQSLIVEVLHAELWISTSGPLVTERWFVNLIISHRFRLQVHAVLCPEPTVPPPYVLMTPLLGSCLGRQGSSGSGSWANTESSPEEQVLLESWQVGEYCSKGTDRSRYSCQRRGQRSEVRPRRHFLSLLRVILINRRKIRLTLQEGSLSDRPWKTLKVEHLLFLVIIKQ